jgi:D-alanyl-D-alanine carboxypeptidase
MEPFLYHYHHGRKNNGRPRNTSRVREGISDGNFSRYVARLREQAKGNAAKKAEAEAKAQMEAEMAAKSADERKLAAAKQTDPARAGEGCGVIDPSSITVVINKKNCFSPLEWAPSDLTGVNGYLLRSEATSQMTKMMQDATAAGSGFGISSAYRSHQNQITTYNNWVQVNGSVAAADTVSARPGYSEHQTGLVADLQTPGCVLECFAGTTSYTWLQANAANYGFINRYPAGLSDITGYAPEAWHWRYVGVATAKDMQTKGIQTLEQYFGIPGGSY